jgi:hypothetical protein
MDPVFSTHVRSTRNNNFLDTESPTGKGAATQLPNGTTLSRGRNKATQGLVRSEIDSDVRCDTHCGRYEATV